MDDVRKSRWWRLREGPAWPDDALSSQDPKIRHAGKIALVVSRADAVIHFTTTQIFTLLVLAEMLLIHFYFRYCIRCTLMSRLLEH